MCGFRWQPPNAFPVKLIKCPQYFLCNFPGFHTVRLAIPCALPWSIFITSHNNSSPKYSHHPGFAFFIKSPACLPACRSLISVYSTLRVLESGITRYGSKCSHWWLVCSVMGAILSCQPRSQCDHL
jgi:hypothetical protein